MIELTASRSQGSVLCGGELWGPCDNSRDTGLPEGSLEHLEGCRMHQCSMLLESVDFSECLELYLSSWPHPLMMKHRGHSGTSCLPALPGPVSRDDLIPHCTVPFQQQALAFCSADKKSLIGFKSYCQIPPRPAPVVQCREGAEPALPGFARLSTLSLRPAPHRTSQHRAH